MRVDRAMPVDNASFPTPDNPLPPPRVGYEFNALENEVFEDLAGRARNVGLGFMIIGVLILMKLYVARDLGTLIAGLVFLMVGIWSQRAARGFDLVRTTKGSDIGHLMTALRELAKLYGLLFMVLLAGVALLLLGLIISLVMTVARMN